MVKLITAPDGAKGFDANVTITPDFAKLFKSGKFDFVARYVGRNQQHPNDITRSEIGTITDAGLGLLLVQHVENPGWVPFRGLGSQYGTNAAGFASAAGFPQGGIIALDLEEVSPAVPEDVVVAYANAWYDQVNVYGYEPMLYVGYHAGISSQSLYSKLKFKRYWSAYNLNGDAYPAVRGVQLRQFPQPSTPLTHAFQYDTDVANVDHLGGRIVLVTK